MLLGRRYCWNLFQTCRRLDICGRHGILRNPKTFVFASETVEFVGFVITPTNIQPSDQGKLHKPMSENTPCAMTIYKISVERSKTFPGHYITIGSCPGVEKFFQFKDRLNTVGDVFINNYKTVIRSSL